MSLYKDRSDFFAQMCRNNKKVAHEHTDESTGDVRMSYCRLNDNEEALAGQVQRMHFPAVIHTDYEVRPTLRDDDERIVITHKLAFLCKAADGSADAIETARDEAEAVLMEFVQWMINEYEENGSCGPFRMIDLSMFSWTAIGPVMQNLYGWELSMREEQRATALTNFQPQNWY